MRTIAEIQAELSSVEKQANELYGCRDVLSRNKRFRLIRCWQELREEMIAAGGVCKGHFCDGTYCDNRYSKRGYKIRNGYRPECGKCWARYNYVANPRDPAWRLNYMPDQILREYQGRHPSESNDEIYDRICRNIDRNNKRNY